MLKKAFTTFCVSLIIVSAGLSQGLLPKLGEQRAGTASMTFLKLGVGARAASMGGAYVAMSDEGSALYWNPAGIVQIGHNELVVSHVDWLLDVKYEFLGYAHQLTPNIGVGAYIGYLHFADMPVTTEYHPYGTGEFFSYNDMVVGLAGSIKMTDRFSFGITAKYVREKLDDIHMSGFLVDFGTYYWTGFKSLRLAASMRNFGADLRPEGTYLRRETGGSSQAEYQAFSPPIVFNLGAAMDVYRTDQHILTTSVQMDHPMDDQEVYVAGVEYNFQKLFALRLGYKPNMPENHWAFGAGFRFPVLGAGLKIDYSYAEFNFLTMTQQITFGFEF